MLATGLAHDGPSAVRYPRGHGPGAALEAVEPLPIGRGRVLRESSARRQPRIALLAFGPLVATALEVAPLIDATVADLRFIKPIDEALIAELARDHALLVTLEDNVVSGGAGSAVAEALMRLRIVRPLLQLGLPDQFVAHGNREQLLADCGLDAAGVLRAIQSRVRALQDGGSEDALGDRGRA